MHDLTLSSFVLYDEDKRCFNPTLKSTIVVPLEDVEASQSHNSRQNYLTGSRDLKSNGQLKK